MKEQLGNYLQYIGYIKATTSLPEFSVYFLPGNGMAEVVLAIDYRKEIYLSEEIYQSIREKFVMSFNEQGFGNVHLMTLVLSNDMDRMQTIFGNDLFSWYLQTDENKLYIPKNHAEDFYGLKKKLEIFLHNPIQFENINKFEGNGEKNVLQEKKKLTELPIINVSLIIVNILLYILCTFTQELIYNKGSFSFFVIKETGEYYRYISSMFLHIDLDHIFSNMLILTFLGNKVEVKIGHIKYVLLYFLSGIVGNLTSAVYEFHLGDMFTSVGASGAIFGVIGATLILILVEGGKWKDITLPRMLLMIAYSLYSGFMTDNVNNAAHIGGFVSGLLIMGIIYMLSRLQKKEVLHEN